MQVLETACIVCVSPLRFSAEPPSFSWWFLTHTRKPRNHTKSHDNRSTQKHPVGVKTAPAFWAFLKKNLVFAIAKLLTCMSKILQFSRGKSSGFNIMTCKLQGFLFGKLARFSFPSQRHMRCMRMCCKFSRTSTSLPHPTPPKKLRSMRMCCKFSRTSTSPPHPTPPKKLRSMRMCCKFSRTSTSPTPPHPTQEVT